MHNDPAQLEYCLQVEIERDALLKNAKELLRLYDGRKEIAEYEAAVADHMKRDPIGPCTNCITTRDKVRKDLLKYGREKAAAMERTRELLTRGK